VTLITHHCDCAYNRRFFRFHGAEWQVLIFWRKNEATEAYSAEDTVKIRADSVFVSTVLFTIALLWLIPKLWADVLTAHDKAWLANMDDAGYRAAMVTKSDLSIASLAVVLIGLIVLWTGYIKRSRPAWFVMCVVAWLWAYPLFISRVVVPLIRRESGFTLPEWLYSAMLGWEIPRMVVSLALVFSLILIALVLPLRRIFGNRQVERPVYRPSAKVVVFSLIGVPVAMTALWIWLDVGVLYELPTPQLMTFLVAPPPPPPPPQAHDAP
jgi:hypothetical protein